MIEKITLFVLSVFVLLVGCEEEEAVVEGTLEPAVLSAPIKGGSNVELKPNFFWKQPETNKPKLLTYDVYTGLTPKAEQLQARDINDSPFQIDNSLEPETTYYWRVVSKIPGKEVSSKSFSFTTEAKQIPVTSVIIAIPGKKTQISAGSNFSMPVEIRPSDATDKTITWRIENANGSSDAIASISEQGELTPISEGTIYVFATSANGGSTDKVEIEILPEDNVPVTSVIITSGEDGEVEIDGKKEKGRVLDIEIGKKTILGAMVAPSDATNTSLKWKVSNPTLANVNPFSGEFVALSTGDESENLVVVTVTTEDGGYTDKLYVKLSKVPVINVDIRGAFTIQVNEITYLRAEVTPSNASIKDVSWALKVGEDEGILTISPQGEVKGIKEGTAIVEAVSVDNSDIKDTQAIVVVKATESSSGGDN